MRIRSIKPEFWKNEAVADLSMPARLLFIGLWNYADREGRMEDRPKRIKAEIFPYDDCDVENLLKELITARFVIRYGGHLAIPTFAKHQRPNIKELPSTYPAPTQHDLENAGTILENAGTILEPTRHDLEFQEFHVSIPLPLRSSSDQELIPLDPNRSLEPSTAEAKEPEPEPIKAEELVASWNSVIAPLGLPKVSALNSDRKQKLKSRIREHPEFEWWDTVFNRIRTSRFLQGDNQRGWTCSFDFLIHNDSNALKIYEGQYLKSEKRESNERIAASR